MGEFLRPIPPFGGGGLNASRAVASPVKASRPLRRTRDAVLADTDLVGAPMHQKLAVGPSGSATARALRAVAPVRCAAWLCPVLSENRTLNAPRRAVAVGVEAECVDGLLANGAVVCASAAGLTVHRHRRRPGGAAGEEVEVAQV